MAIKTSVVHKRTAAEWQKIVAELMGKTRLVIKHIEYFETNDFRLLFHLRLLRNSRLAGSLCPSRRRRLSPPLSRSRLESKLPSPAQVLLSDPCEFLTSSLALLRFSLCGIIMQSDTAAEHRTLSSTLSLQDITQDLIDDDVGDDHEIIDNDDIDAFGGECFDEQGFRDANILCPNLEISSNFNKVPLHTKVRLAVALGNNNSSRAEPIGAGCKDWFTIYDQIAIFLEDDNIVSIFSIGPTGPNSFVTPLVLVIDDEVAIGLQGDETNESKGPGILFHPSGEGRESGILFTILVEEKNFEITFIFPNPSKSDIKGVRLEFQ
ncbi:hypothetical protein M5K25_026649 [Dendrobium thyrsiflorum]|uniref:Uncharacterized protein n=1 Tax=Dendrobium thyrsiflorum TaxID=117978 RepID=A0ABD0TXW3_DENTH